MFCTYNLPLQFEASILEPMTCLDPCKNGHVILDEIEFWKDILTIGVELNVRVFYTY